MKKELVQEAQKHTAIQDVYIRESHAFIQGDFDPKVSNPALAIQIRFGTEEHTVLNANENDAPQKLLRVRVGAGIRFVDSEAEEHDLDEESVKPSVRAEILAEFVADYLVTKEDLSEDVLREFAQHNAPFHVWPYWREYAHSMCGRMRLPEVVLPMFRLTKGESPEDVLSVDRIEAENDK